MCNWMRKWSKNKQTNKQTKQNKTKNTTKTQQTNKKPCEMYLVANLITAIFSSGNTIFF